MEDEPSPSTGRPIHPQRRRARTTAPMYPSSHTSTLGLFQQLMGSSRGQSDGQGRSNSRSRRSTSSRDSGSAGSAGSAGRYRVERHTHYADDSN